MGPKERRQSLDAFNGPKQNLARIERKKKNSSLEQGLEFISYFTFFVRVLVQVEPFSPGRHPSVKSFRVPCSSFVFRFKWSPFLVKDIHL